MKKSFVLLCFICMSTFTYSQKHFDEISAEFFNKYAYNTEIALDYIFETNPWLKENLEGMNNVKSQIKEYETLIGNYVGYEKISEEILGESLAYVVYMVKYERQPIRFMFQYYKSKDSWMLYHIKYDEGMIEEFKTAK